MLQGAFCLGMTTAWGLTGQLQEIPKELDHAKIAPKNRKKKLLSDCSGRGDRRWVHVRSQGQPINRLSTDGSVSMTTQTQIRNRALHALTSNVHVVSTQDHATALVVCFGFAVSSGLVASVWLGDHENLFGAVSTWKGKTDVPNRLWIGIDAAPVNNEVVVYTSRR